ncbi:hypothetical protein DL98DRAFT_501701 [Cadophora sp. DSE1049]|nr:hypothetical protein DL98DRAFT_501701 [Cadophora sp. DSE1049]
MYSRDATVTAVLRFYHSIIRHPYLNSSTLTIPPRNGWPNINFPGKTNNVLDLLRHLPYLRAEKQYDQFTIHWECVPICYVDLVEDDDWQDLEKSYGLPPLPPHCVYLARAGSYLNTSLILDAETGTVIEYSVMANDITIPIEEYERLPVEERWKVHRATPVVEFFEGWRERYERLVWMLVPNPIGQPVTGRFHSRAEGRREEEVLLRGGGMEEISVEDEGGGDEEMDGLDQERYLVMERRREHVADIYNMFLRHGWPDHFDKERCRVELLELEKSKDAEERKRMDEMNPDAALFE